ncbi:hypothetical protein ACFE04_013203 [Oxalis oulophora]
MSSSGVVYADEPNPTEDLGYKPPHDYIDFSKKSVVDIQMNDSTELWLIQWANNQQPDFDGQELILDLNKDGRLGGFEDSSGKAYDLVSFKSHEPDATVFLPSTSEAKAVGKISRRVSLIHYPDPNEHESLNANSLRDLKTSSKSNLTGVKSSSQRFATPTRSSKPSSRHPTSTLSNRGAASTDRSTIDTGGSSKHSGKGSSKRRSPNFLLNLAAAEFRYHIFSKEMPSVFQAVFNGDSKLSEEHSEQMDAIVWVYFHSSLPKYNRMECWGPLNDAAKVK